MKNYDVAIIGTGGGNKLASAMAKLGKSVALIEKAKAGGTCLNRGCIPSKMLIHPAHLAGHLNEISKINIDVEQYSVDFSALVKRINSYTDGVSDRIAEGRLESEKIDYYQGAARFSGARQLTVSGQSFTAEKIFIATGSRPNIPKIAGLAHTPFMTSNEALRSQELPKDLAIIGGGYIAAELGAAYAALGSNVTFIVRSKMLAEQDHEIREQFLAEFSADDPKATKTILEHTQAKSVSYSDKKFTVELEENPNLKETRLVADQLLICAGITPNSDQLSLDQTGVRTDQKGFIEVNDFLETSERGVFALGDVAGNYLFRHSVNFEAEYLIESQFIADKPYEISYPPMPAAMFTSPEIACVGLTEEQASKDNISVIIGTAKYASTAMARARGQENGLVKLLFHAESHQLIGAHIVGDEASTMFQELVLAATHKLTAKQINEQIYIHPAYPEVIKSAVKSAMKQIDSKYKIIF